MGKGLSNYMTKNDKKKFKPTAVLKPTVVWEKWMDPFDVDDEKEALNLADESKFDTPHITDFEYQELMSDPTSTLHKPQNNMRGIFTTIGFVPITEYGKPSSVFNFWTLHSNFIITPKVLKIIKKTPGIETLDVFTQYRARIAIGKAFKEQEQEVRKHVETRMFETLTKKSTQTLTSDDEVLSSIIKILQEKE